MNSVASKPITVLLVEDNEGVADALRLSLAREADMDLLGWIRTADDLAPTLSERCPDVAIVDLDMPGLDPITAIRTLTEAGCHTRFVVFTGNTTPRAIERSLDSGAWGYVCKSDGAPALIRALRQVARGEFALSPEARRLYQHD